MKNKIKTLILPIFILIILFIKIFFLREISEIQKNDDFLFLKLLSNGEFLSNEFQNNKKYQIVNRK